MRRKSICLAHGSRNSFASNLAILFAIGSWVGCVVCPFIFLWLRWWLSLCVYAALCLSPTPFKVFNGSDFMKSHYFNYFKTFDVCMEETKKDTTNKTIFMSHTHGMFNFGILGYSLWSGVHISCDHHLAVRTPLHVFASLQGVNLFSNAKRAVNSWLQTGNNMIISIGGFQEATLTCWDTERVYIRKRKGLFKYAMKYGYKMVPVHIVGENRLYYNSQIFLSFRLWLNTFAIPSILPWGRTFAPLMPIPSPLTVVVGAPFECPHIEAPTDAQISETHSAYMTHLEAFYNKNDIAVEFW